MKGLLNETIRASLRATKAQKDAAARMAFEQRGTPFVFNAFLNLLARGARTTESNVIGEAKRILAANERHFAGQLDRRASERPAA